MSDMNPPRARLAALLERVAAQAPDFRIDLIISLAEHGEGRIALEILCDNLSEDGVALSQEIRVELAGVCEAFGVDQAYWR